MANEKISAQTDGAPLVATDEFIIARSGANRKVDPDDIVTYVDGKLTKHIYFSATDTTTDLATGTTKAVVVVPAELDGYDITGVQANVVTAGTTGTMTIQIVIDDSTPRDLLSTEINIASAAIVDDNLHVINTTASNDQINTGDIISFDIDVVHTTPAKGLFITLTCTLP
jgi:hypothetical protein